MQKLLWICLIGIILLCIVIGGLNCWESGEGKEEFGFYDNLWPSRDTYCEERGLKKSYMPQKCIVLDDGGNVKAWDRYRNCRCVNPKTGFCASCYPRVNPIDMNVVPYGDN